MTSREPKDLSFLFHKDVQRIFNNFTALFQIRIAFFSPDGRELKVGQNRDLCAYCRMIRLCPGGEEACQAEDRNARKRAMEKQSLTVYTCHGGMTEAVKPIILDDRLLGFAMIGQIRMSETAPARWGSLWGVKNKPPSLQDAYEAQPVCRKADLPRILELFSDLMDLLSSQGKINRQSEDRMKTLVHWMKDHMNEPLTLGDGAKEMSLSESRLSHLIKEASGSTFTGLLRGIRMEKARFLLSHFPEKSVKAVALSVGYKDPLYFSKHFRQDCGMTPNMYKKQQNLP